MLKAMGRDILIATIYLLGGAGGRKVSMPEVMDAVKRIQEHLPLGYAFWDRFLYSPDLADDLESLMLPYALSSKFFGLHFTQAISLIEHSIPNTHSLIPLRNVRDSVQIRRYFKGARAGR
jgi:hypothetical protein